MEWGETIFIPFHFLPQHACFKFQAKHFGGFFAQSASQLPRKREINKLAPQQGQKLLEGAHAAYFIYVDNKWHEPEAAVPPAHLYPCADILTGVCIINAPGNTDEFLSVF